MKKTFHIILIAISAITTLFLASAVGAQQRPSTQENKLLFMARESAILAGSARFCKFDPDNIEEFMARVDARIALVASDEYEKVLARLEFKNVLDAYTVRAPSEGCASFFDTFERVRKSFQ